MKIPPLLAHVAVFLGAALVAAFASAAETKRPHPKSSAPVS